LEIQRSARGFFGQFWLEISIAAAFVAAMLAISLVTGLPVQTPSASSAMAIGTRWHYAIDLPVGIALAQLCIWASPRLIA
jgi:hypothetical protein